MLENQKCQLLEHLKHLGLTINLLHTAHHVLGNEFGLAIDESESLSGMNIVLG